MNSPGFLCEVDEFIHQGIHYPTCESEAQGIDNQLFTAYFIDTRSPSLRFLNGKFYEVIKFADCHIRLVSHSGRDI